MMYEVKEDNWRTCIFYLPDLLGWPDLARLVNSHHVRGCLFAIWTWQEKCFMRILAFSWKLTYMSINISWAQVSNFKKIWAFVAEIFAKLYWLSKIILFPCIFHILSITCLKSLQRWIITKKLWNFWETRYQNGNLLGEFSI